MSGKTLVWKEHHSAEAPIDFAALYGPPSEYRLAYAVCYVHADADRTDLALRVGSDDQAMLYLNGEEVYRQPRRGQLLQEALPHGPEGGGVFVGQGEEPDAVPVVQPGHLGGQADRVAVAPAAPEVVLAAVGAAVRTAARQLDDGGPAQPETAVAVPVAMRRV